MITIDGVTYRNLEEQVRFNQQNINTSATAIAAETERAKAAESANSTAIAQETTDRKSADSTITTSLNSEVSRAKAAEELNATNISTNKANITANTTDIATNAKNIADEIFRAEAAESANATAISNETTARANADTVIDNKLSEEISRAKTADDANSKAITDETTRATGIESNLRIDVDANTAAILAESTARDNADTALGERIDTERNTANNEYVKNMLHLGYYDTYTKDSNGNYVVTRKTIYNDDGTQSEASSSWNETIPPRYYARTGQTYVQEYAKSEADRSSNLTKVNSSSGVSSVILSSSLQSGQYTLSLSCGTDDAFTILSGSTAIGTHTAGTASFSLTFTISSVSSISISGTAGSYAYSNIMLNRGSVALPYQPYEGKTVHETGLTKSAVGLSNVDNTN
jgi:hypothetical protein